MKDRLLIIFILTFLFTLKFFPQTLLDNFESAKDWQIYKSDGVEAEVSVDEGYSGKGIRFDYNFTKGTGYGGIQKIVPLDIPENFQFTFYVKAESPGNNFEIKFIDSTGQNVWWVNNRNYTFPTEWIKIKIKKRHISFAWGPIEDKSLKRIDRIEFTIASFVGGKGTVWIDELKFEELSPEDNSPIVPVISASSEADKNSSVKNIDDGNLSTQWKSKEGENQEIILSLNTRREFGGIVIDWDGVDYAKDFDVFLSPDNKEWEKVYSVKEARGSRSYIRLKEEDALKIKIDLLKSSRGKGYSVKEISIKNIDYSTDINKFFINIAKDYPRGYFPRYLNEEGTFWTVAGVNNDVKEALINEDGMVEVDKLNFSIEPFLSVNGKFVTWND
ncbi:MAG TPA: discoidin domain-containing protein, partial [Ignavibacteriaceae bacterium]|nr:discoidin domain-containing protein [Ignavibacteriaceae bacterium]